MQALRPETEALRYLIAKSGLTRRQIYDHLKAVESRIENVQLKASTVDNLLTDRRSLETHLLREILNLLGISMPRFWYIAEHFSSVQESNANPGPLSSKELGVAEILSQARRGDESSRTAEIDSLSLSEDLHETLLRAFDQVSALRVRLRQRAKE